MAAWQIIAIPPAIVIPTKTADAMSPDLTRQTTAVMPIVAITIIPNSTTIVSLIVVTPTSSHLYNDRILVGVTSETRYTIRVGKLSFIFYMMIESVRSERRRFDSHRVSPQTLTMP